MSLFVLASKDGWVNIMYHGLDAVGVDQQVRVLLHKPPPGAIPLHPQKLGLQRTIWLFVQYII